jgi:hypothetical protein
VKRILSSSFVAMWFFAAAVVFAQPSSQSSSSPDPRVIAGTVNVFIFPTPPGPTASDPQPDDEDGRFQRALGTRVDMTGPITREIRIRVASANDDPHAAELIGAIAGDSPVYRSLASDDGLAPSGGRKTSVAAVRKPARAGGVRTDARCASPALSGGNLGKAKKVKN